MERSEDKMSFDLLKFLKELKGKKIIYTPNPGNAGDSLIASSTLDIFKKINLDFEIQNPKNKFNKKTIIYGGGGNLIDKYDNLRNFLWKNLKDNRIIVLPHTFSHCDKLLNRIGSNVTLIARERVSFDYIKTHMRYPENALLSDDMAFHLDNLDFYINEPNAGICNVFRLDKEKTSVDIPDNNKDVSADFIFKQNTLNESHIKISADNLLRYLSKFEEINTNRLHVGIAGSLLGRKVNLFPNSYYKNEAVFSFSIKNKYKNTSFIN
jgi:exopolysaccharide biosynthesis predicted pyruvyltransferase EpsI